MRQGGASPADEGMLSRAHGGSSVPHLVTTLRSLLAQADAHFDSGRIAQARAAFEDLLERSQEKTDHAMEVVAHTMLAHVHLRRRDPEAARHEIGLAAERLDPNHLESHARYRAVLARLALADSAPEVARQELLDYLRWSEEVGAHGQTVDAALLLAEADRDDQRAWLQRAIDSALENGVEDRLAGAYTSLGAVLDAAGRHEEALEAWEQAHAYQLRFGTPRQVVAAAWAVGALACKLEDWPLALSRLDEAVSGAERAEDCDDLLALALADVAKVYEAAGDVIEARRLLLRAATLARQQDLPRFWPDRWHDLLEHGRRLELDL